MYGQTTRFWKNATYLPPLTSALSREKVAGIGVGDLRTTTLSDQNGGNCGVCRNDVRTEIKIICDITSFVQYACVADGIFIIFILI